MKKLSILIIALTLSLTSMAQAPQAFAFQSAISDTTGEPVANKPIEIQFVIHEGSAMGTSVYTENHSDTTSALGYFNVNVGAGTPTSGVFNTIDWSTGEFYLELFIDQEDGNGYVTLGSSRLLAVPYALYAEKTRPSVYFIGTSTGGSGVLGTVEFTESVINRGSGYTSGTFTAPFDGIYEINFSSTDNGANVEFLHNGVGIPSLSVTSFSQSFEFSAGDTFEVLSSSVDGSTLKIVEIK